MVRIMEKLIFLDCMMTMMAKKKSRILPWLYGILMSVFIIFVVLFGIETFYKSPRYEDFCDVVPRKPLEPNATADDTYYYQGCNDTYTSEMQKYNERVFYIMSVIGLLLVALSLFVSTTFIEISTMISGFLLMIIALSKNIQNKPMVFVSSLVMLALVVYIGKRKLGD